MKKVIYTAIFGDYDDIVEPEYLPEGFDFICFTDSDIKSKVWNVRKVLPLYEDSTRNARKYKLLPHRFLSDYDVSIWVDGNFLIKDNLNQLIEKKMNNCNMVFHDHNQCLLDPRDCVYDEGNAILWLGNNDPNKKYKDNPNLIIKQLNKYKDEGYPQHNGLIVSGVLIRRHNESDVIETMELWWEELKDNSKLHQLSFNYSAWKTNLKFNYIDGDIRDNKYFYLLSHNHQKKRTT